MCIVLHRGKPGDMARGQAKGNSGGNMNQQTTTSQDHEKHTSEAFHRTPGVQIRALEENGRPIRVFNHTQSNAEGGGVT